MNKSEGVNGFGGIAIPYEFDMKVSEVSECLEKACERPGGGPDTIWALYEAYKLGFGRGFEMRWKAQTGGGWNREALNEQE